MSIHFPRRAVAAAGAGLIALGAGLFVAVTRTSGAPDTGTAKQQYAQALASERAADIAAHTPRPKSSIASPTPMTGSKPQRQAGILDIHQGPVPTSVFLSSNLWQGPVNGSGDLWYVVYAGQNMNADGSAGAPAVIVDTTTPTPDGYGFTHQIVGTFPDASADGPFTITNQSGTVVSLQTASGHVYTFDILTHHFQ